VEAAIGAAFINPGAKLGPVIKQSLMRHLGHGLTGATGQGHHARVVGSELAQYGQHIELPVAPPAQLAKRGPTARVAGAFAELHQPHQGSPRNHLLGFTEGAVDSLCRAGQGTADAADIPQRCSRRLASEQAFPDARQRELQQRQGPLAAASLRQQQLNRRLIDRHSSPERRLSDRPAQLILAHRGHEHRLLGDEPVELWVLPVGFAQEIAAQGHDDRDMARRVAGRVEEQADEGVALGRLSAGGVNLLKLVHE
jgi:hypothetical protein